MRNMCREGAEAKSHSWKPKEYFFEAASTGPGAAAPAGIPRRALRTRFRPRPNAVLSRLRRRVARHHRCACLKTSNATIPKLRFLFRQILVHSQTLDRRKIGRNARDSGRGGAAMTEQLVQQLLNFITLGSIYALVAVGFSLLFGVLNIIHFSHGDVSLIAPFIALAVIQAAGAAVGGAGSPLAIGVALLGAIAITGLIGVLLDILIIQRFRSAPAMMALVATVALGIVLRELIRHLFPNGSNPHAFPRLVSGGVDLLGVSLPAFNLLAIVIAVLAVGALFALLNHTRLGLHIKAVSQDHDAARLLSISPGRIFRTTFFIASAIGAVGGLFFASYAGIVRFDFSIDVGLIGFSAAVVGGLGSMPGAIIGSLLIAGLDVLVQATAPGGASYRLVFIFLLVIGVLVFRPAGLLGRTPVEKV